MPESQVGRLLVSYPESCRLVDPAAVSWTRDRGDDSALVGDETIATEVEQAMVAMGFVAGDRFAVANVRSQQPAGGGLRVAPSDGRGVLLVERDGAWSWVLADEDRAGGPAVFDIPLDGEDRILGGAFGWLKGQFFSLTIDRPFAAIAERAEKSVVPGLVHITDATDVSAWSPIADPESLGLGDGRNLRLLLLVHGTFSSTIGGFQALTKSGPFLGRALRHYDAVVGFDHRTLTMTPEENARELLETLTALVGSSAASMDVIVHSRGGLVARSLVEGMLSKRARPGGPDLTVQNVVFVGTPNSGTALVHPTHIKAFIDTYTTLAVASAKVIGAATGTGPMGVFLGQMISGLAAVAEFLLSHAIEREAIPGLSAMNPEGDFLGRMNRHAGPSGVRYLAIVSDYEPRQHGLFGELPLVVADAAADRFFRRANDLVVDTYSMTAMSDDDVIDARLRFDSDVYHTIYFTQRDVGEALTDWLGLSTRSLDRVSDESSFPSVNGMRSSGPEQLVPDQIALPNLRVEVVWGDIAQSPAGKDTEEIVSVGHYDGVLPEAAEHALDRRLSGLNPDDSAALTDRRLVLASMTRRNALPSGVGDVTFLPMAVAGQTAAVCGMGLPGYFTPADQEALYRSLGGRIARLGSTRALSTVLIGAGYGTLTTERALEGLVAGLRYGLASGSHSTAAVENGTRLVIRLVEIHRHKALFMLDRLRSMPGVDVANRGRLLKKGGGGWVSTGYAVNELLKLLDSDDRVTMETTLEDALKLLPRSQGRAETAAELRRSVGTDGKGTVGDAVRTFVRKSTPVEGGRARPAKPTDLEKPTDIDRLSIMSDGTRIRVSAIESQGATIPERALSVDLGLLDELSETMTNPRTRPRLELGALLRQLVIPEGFSPVLERRGPIVFVVDRSTAASQWETMACRAPTEDETDSIQPLGIERAVARQLRTTYSASPGLGPRPIREERRALIVGDPSEEYPLPGAAAEAEAVRDLFIASGRFARDDVDFLVGRAATRVAVLRRLLTRQIDLVHYAGHGTYDIDDPSRTGWVFDGGLITSGEIARMKTVPSLIFANACVTGRLSRGRQIDDIAHAVDREEGLLPSLADEFFRQGVFNYLGTAWNVNDIGAVEFASTFYRRFLEEDVTIGEALLDVRKRLFEEDRTALWAAYHHYGDPAMTLATM